MKTIAKILLKIAGYATVVLVVLISGYLIFPPDSSDAEQPAETEEDPTLFDRLGSDLSSWNSSYRPLVELTKQSMNNPGSFEHVESRFREIGDDRVHVIMVFRGENAYGGTVTNTVEATADIDTGEILSVQRVDN